MTNDSAIKVAAFCNRALVTAEVGDTLVEAARTMVRNHVGALAVMAAGRLVGVVSEGDIAVAVAEDATFDSTAVEEYMTENPITVSPEDGAELVARRMLQHGVHHLPVVEGTDVVGMVSVRDLLEVGVPSGRPPDKPVGRGGVGFPT